MKTYFTDQEYRILLSALSRERKVCAKIDEKDGNFVLTNLCDSIEEKIQNIQYQKNLYMTDANEINNDNIEEER